MLAEAQPHVNAHSLPSSLTIIFLFGTIEVTIMRKYIFYSAFFVITPFFFLISLIITLLLYRANSPTLAQRESVAYAALPTTQNIFSGTITQEDGRVVRIYQFLTKYHSPLAPYAQDLVAAADQYGLDFRLLTAIAMQESNVCKKIPVDSYNCWGFGIYGKKVTRFSDYKEGIYTVTKTLANKYKRDKGLVTPEQIVTMYTPSNDGSWAFSVNHFMKAME